MAKRLTWSEGGSGERRQDLQVVRRQWRAELRQQGLWQLPWERDHRGGNVTTPQAVPQFSDDGNWWWNGTKWLPVQGTPADPASAKSNKWAWIVLPTAAVAAVGLIIMGAASSSSPKPSEIRNVSLGEAVVK